MIRFLLTRARFSTVRRVEVLSLARAPRSARLPIRRRPADLAKLALDPGRTTPEVFECSEIRPVYRSITRSIAAMDEYIERLDRLEEPRRRLRDLAQDMRYVGLDLGGQVELAYGEERC